jgi:hypothetical protein
VSPVSRGRGKKNRSAKGPVGKRAAARRLPVGEDPDLVWPLDRLGPVGTPREVAGGAGGAATSLADVSELLSGLPGAVRGDAGSSGGWPGMSWVSIERLAREKAGPPGAGRGRPYRDDAEALTDAQLLDRLRGFGIVLDRAGLQALCQDALSAQEVSSQLLERHVSASQRGRQESDWVWLAVLTLWQRWWPDKPCLETIDDKIQEGYDRSEDSAAATDSWLQAWSDVLHLCDATNITTIAGFDRRFPLTQSLFNWHQDLEMELGNAGLDDPAKLQARITVGEEVLRRFTDCGRLEVENWRRAIAEAWFWLGEAGKAEELFSGWLDDDPQWGFGWVGWASGYLPPPRASAPVDCRRAEELLLQGLAVSGVRDREAIADWLRRTRDEGERQPAL